MEHVSCDLCGADETEPRLEHEGWTIVRCRGCGLVYLDPRPDLEVIERDFDWFRHSPLQTGRRRKRENPVRTLLRRLRGRGLLRRTPREEVVRRRIAEFVPPGRFLDVGCGEGTIIDALAAHGYDAQGIDLSAEAVRIARQRGQERVRQGTLHDAGLLEEGSFDAVLMMSVLEHEHQPTRALARIHELLAPGGHLFVKVPHYGSWNRMLLGRRWSGYFFPQHLYYYTPGTAAALLEKTGYEVVRNGFLDHVPFSDVFWITARKPGSR